MIKKLLQRVFSKKDKSAKHEPTKPHVRSNKGVDKVLTKKVLTKALNASPAKPTA
jgi:hypothetical protein